MKDIRTGEPYINVWFGNFYSPAYDSKKFVSEGIKFLKDCGFNSIMLDSKAWEDFRDRYEGKEASPYVEAQEYMQKCILNEGLSYVHMALYLNADNLYPHIRFSPPIYGESVVNSDGSDGKWYKYWSDKAKSSMVEHIKGLYKIYGSGFTRCETNDKNTVEMMCTMWDPIIAPSFDADGSNRYISWLRDKYTDITALNKAYNTSFSRFDEIALKDVWFSCVFEKPIYTYKDFSQKNPAVSMWSDNMLWKRDEICNYFKDMQKRLKEISPSIYTCPDMAQWSYFLNIDATALSNVGFSDLWDTANRGIDIYKAAKYVDCAHFIAVPITPYGTPDSYVLSCQHSMMRAMNEGREFIGGVYWGRFLYMDIYEFLTPCEIIGSMVGSGISGYTSYGMCGLDDGGVLHRMSKTFNASLKLGNDWAKKIIPAIKGKRKKQVAILFPSSMALVEPMATEGNKERRYDLLGYYKICCDFGYMADVIDTNIIAEGRLSHYQALIIPENDCYDFDINTAAEQKLIEWVNNGGTVIASPNNKIRERVFGIKSEIFNGNPIWYGEGGLTQSDIFEFFTDGECIVKYCSDAKQGAMAYDKAAVVRHDLGSGHIYSFGFAYGYSYCAKIAPHVPLSQKNNELYPIPLMKNNIVNDILIKTGVEPCPETGRNIETAVFEDCMIIINHNSEPIEININGEKIFQYDINGHTLMPRSAVYIHTEQN